MDSTLTDVITSVIKSMMNGEDEIVLQRNYMAKAIGCSPAQINYVLASRFTAEKGFQVNTKRGGGGGVTVKRISDDDECYKVICDRLIDEIERMCLDSRKALSMSVDVRTLEKLYNEKGRL